MYDVDRFRPLSGNLLSLLQAQKALTRWVTFVFVPYRGIYFLCVYDAEAMGMIDLFSSPIGESTFSTIFEIFMQNT